MGRYKERSVETFAAIPVSVMASEAYKTLRPKHQAVLWLLAAQYRGNNNGDLALTRKMAKHFGLNNERTRCDGLRLLEERGLIIKTFQGGKGLGHRSPTLWALAWKAINYRDREELPVVAVPSSDWRKWRKPDTQNSSVRPHVASQDCTHD